MVYIDFRMHPQSYRFLLDSPSFQYRAPKSGLVLDGSQRVDSVIKKAIQWDVMGGMARRAWARNAVHAALYNVQVNLGSIKDQVFVDKTSARVKEIQTQV